MNLMNLKCQLRLKYSKTNSVVYFMYILYTVCMYIYIYNILKKFIHIYYVIPTYSFHLLNIEIHTILFQSFILKLFIDLYYIYLLLYLSINSPVDNTTRQKTVWMFKREDNEQVFIMYNDCYISSTWGYIITYWEHNNDEIDSKLNRMIEMTKLIVEMGRK